VIYLLLSAHNHKAHEAIEAGFHSERVGRESLFFDEIAVYRLRLMA
jgi:hypothetical protein